MCRSCAILVAVVAAFAHASIASPPANATKLPSWDQVANLVTGSLTAQSRAPHEIITREDVSGVWEKLQRAGFTVADRGEIESLLLTEQSLVVRQLRTNGGKQLMSKLGSKPNTYDKFDRLSQIPRGEQIIRDLTTAKDGYKLLEYMSGPQAGGMSKEIGRLPQGANFDQPTGKIYTTDQFLSRLKTSYAQASKKK